MLRRIIVGTITFFVVRLVLGLFLPNIIALVAAIIVALVAMEVAAGMRVVHEE